MRLNLQKILLGKIAQKFAKNLVPIYSDKIEGKIPYGNSDILSKRFLRGVGLINDKF